MEKFPSQPGKTVEAPANKIEAGGVFSLLLRNLHKCSSSLAVTVAGVDSGSPHEKKHGAREKFTAKEDKVRAAVTALSVIRDKKALLNAAPDLLRVIESYTKFFEFSSETISNYFSPDRSKEGRVGVEHPHADNDLCKMVFQLADRAISSVDEVDLEKMTRAKVIELKNLAGEVIARSLDPLYVEAGIRLSTMTDSLDVRKSEGKSGQALQAESEKREARIRIDEQWLAVSMEFNYDRFDLPAYEGARGLLKSIIAKYGVDPDKALASWRSVGRLNNERAANEEEDTPRFFGNIKNIQMVEQLKKGAAGQLYKEYGIRNFCRYEPAMLATQLGEENEQYPYGIIVGPVEDWNGGLSQRTAPSIWGGIKKGLYKAGYLVRVVEAGSKIELARHLIKFNKKYGDKNKISFVVLSGHGSEDGLDLGTYTSWPGGIKELAKGDLEGSGVRRAGEFFTEKPIIILDSCSTGVENGIGQEMSVVYGAEVVAPNKPSSMKEIRVSVSRAGRLKFDVKFNEEGIRRKYLKGKEVKK